MAPVLDMLALGGAAVILALFWRSARTHTRQALQRCASAQQHAASCVAKALPEGPSQAQIVAFLRGEGVDDQGRTLAQVLEFSDLELEMEHDFIQWLFPSPDASLCHPEAPVASAQTFQALRQDPLAVHGLLQAFERMLKFYGLRRDASGRGLALYGRHADVSGWLKGPTHNDLRLTRMLRALSLCGQQAQADLLLSFLLVRFAASEDPHRQASLSYWREAAQAGAHSLS